MTHINVTMTKSAAPSPRFARGVHMRREIFRRRMERLAFSLPEAPTEWTDEEKRALRLNALHPRGFHPKRLQLLWRHLVMTLRGQEE